MALLRIEGLTLQFGGLTAVKDFDLDVPAGEIVAVIGPNGAGKTTVFNAVTGIYEPTKGTIRFEGEEIIRPWGVGIFAAATAVALVTGIALGLLGLNVDRLWGAALRRPHATARAIKDLGLESGSPLAFADEPRVPTFRQALSRYLSGELDLRFFNGNWRIITPDDAVELTRSKDEAEARALRWKLERMRRLESPRIEQRAMRFAVLDEQDEPLMTYLTREEAARDLRLLGQSTAQAAGRIQLAWLSAAAGLLLGFAGTITVWYRSRRTTDLVARAGLARTFQNIRLFHNMTVLENVLVGMDRYYPSNWLGMLLWWPGHRVAEQEADAKAVEILKFVELDQRQDALAKDLSYGQQRRLEIARALATEPKLLLLLLDEPAAGTNPTESEELMHLIRAIRDRGVTVLLIEHHMQLVMGISDRIAVLEYGVKIAEGTPDEVRNNPKVIEAYLGQEEEH